MIFGDTDNYQFESEGGTIHILPEIKSSLILNFGYEADYKLSGNRLVNMKLPEEDGYTLTFQSTYFVNTPGDDVLIKNFLKGILGVKNYIYPDKSKAKKYEVLFDGIETPELDAFYFQATLKFITVDLIKEL